MKYVHEYQQFRMHLGNGDKIGMNPFIGFYISVLHYWHKWLPMTVNLSLYDDSVHADDENSVHAPPYHDHDNLPDDHNSGDVNLSLYDDHRRFHAALCDNDSVHADDENSVHDDAPFYNDHDNVNAKLSLPETYHSFHAAFCDDDSAHAALADNNNSVHLVSASNPKNAYAKSAQVQSPCRANDIRCVALNVSGLNAKLRNGVLDQYLSKFDIVSLVETNTDSPVISETLLNSYSCFTMKKSNSTCKYKYGGIHGICVLVSPTYKENVELISDTVSECTLWLKITSNNTAHCILGAMYIPCEKSRFYFDEVFDQIENDILDLKSRFELPFCLFGDFNAHTQLKDDFLEYDDTVAEITGCDLFRESSFVDCQNINPGFTRYRYSQDASDMNRNGKYLLALCQALDFKIVNGRLGSDKYIGRPTCHKSEAASVIDYVLASECMLPYVSHFHVEMFDPCFSDVHCPIEFNVSTDVPAFNYVPETETSLCSQEKTDSETLSCEPEVLPKMSFKWSKESADDFQNAISESKLIELSQQLRNLSSNITQESVDHLCSSLSEIMINAAKTAGIYKELRRVNSKKNGEIKKKSPPWFDKECVEKRRDYYKMKNYLKRKGAKAVCNKKAKEFKKFIKNKEKCYFKQLNMKIRSLRSSNSKEYWSLLNRSAEGKKTFSTLCLQTFMDHFKQLSQKYVPYDTCDPCEKTESTFPTVEHNESLNVNFSLPEIKEIIAKLNKSFQWGSNIRPRPSSFEIGQFGSFCDFIYVGVKAEVCATGAVCVNR